MSEPISENVQSVEVKPDAPRKIAIVGEIPFSGRTLAQAIMDLGMVARVLCPDSAVEAALKGMPQFQAIEIVDGNLGNPTAVDSALEGVYGVCFISPVNLSGRIYRSEEHLEDVKCVIQAAEKHALRKLVYHSAVGLGPTAASRALRDAAAAEELISKSRCEEYKIRTGPIVGKGDGFLTEIVDQASASGPFMTVMGYGDTLVQPLAVTDFARCLAQLFAPRADTLRNGVHTLVGPEILTLLELSDKALKILQRNKLKFHIPKLILKVVASAARSEKFRERVALIFDAFAVDQNDAPKFMAAGAKLQIPGDIERELLEARATGANQ